MIATTAKSGNGTTAADKNSAASTIHSRVANGGERYWRVSDFGDLPVLAVSQTLSRLTKSGVLSRAGKGLYYHPRATVFGASRPSESDLGRHALGALARPAGRTAANLLGFTTQNAAVPEYATSANNSSTIMPNRARVYTRRPESWNRLSDVEAAILDLLRSRAIHSELDERMTEERLLALVIDDGRFGRLAAVAGDEPPRVRAILGAIGQQIGVAPEAMTELRKSINPLSRFDFGRLRRLRHAHEWQAK